MTKPRKRAPGPKHVSAARDDGARRMRLRAGNLDAETDRLRRRFRRRSDADYRALVDRIRAQRSEQNRLAGLPVTDREKETGLLAAHDADVVTGEVVVT